jgi:hypothetical protein
MKKVILAALLAVPLEGTSQTINGPTSVEVGETHRYDLYDQVTYAQPDWSYSTICSPGAGGHDGNYYVNITFDQGDGTADVVFKDGSTTIATLQVTVSATPPATPSATVTTTYNCGNTVVAHPGVAEEVTFRWYWQTTSTGTETSLGYASSITRTVSGNLYLRARLKALPNTWSTGALHAGNIVVNSSPPAAPSVPTHGLRFGSGALTISAATVSGAMEYRWYLTSSGGNKIQNQYANSYSLGTVTSNATYYIASWNGCESSRLAVNATILSVPTIVTTGPSGRSINMGESVTLSTSTAYDEYAWKKAGSTVGTSSTYTTSEIGTFTVVVTKTGAVNTGTSSSYDVFAGLNGQNMNFVTTNIIQVPGVSSTSSITGLTVNQNSQSNQFVDGLGCLSPQFSGQNSLSSCVVIAWDPFQAPS